MSQNYQKLFRDAMLTNTYDKSSMDLSLKLTHENSYSYLYALQRSIIDYDEFHYDSNTELFENKRIIGKFYLDSSENACVDIDYEMIKEPLREIYRRSKFYHVRITEENKKEFISTIHPTYHDLDNKVYIQTPYYSRLLTEKNISEYIGHTVKLGITPKNISEYPEIFRKIPVIMIDNKVIWDWVLFCNEGSITIKIPSKGRNFVIREERDENNNLVYEPHHLDVFTIDNIIPIRTIRASRSTLNYSILDHSIRFSKSKVVSTPDKTSDGIMFCSLHFPNKNGVNYELGTSMIELQIDGEEYVGYLTDQQHEQIMLYDKEYKPNTEKFFYLTTFFINRLRCHYYPYEEDDVIKTQAYTTASFNKLNESIETRLAVIENDDYNYEVTMEDRPYQMPVPIEDLLVFKQVNETNGFSNDYHMCHNTEVVSLNYPNIYRITDKKIVVGNNYKIYYFYKEGDSLKYTQMFDFYITYLRNILFGVKDKKLEIIYNDIFSRNHSESLKPLGYSDDDIENIRNTFIHIIKYKDFVYHYGDIDFLKRYLPMAENHNKDPFEYKVETLRQWVNYDRDALQQYILDQKKVGKMYHMFTNTIDLKNRLRTDNSIEGDGNTTFDEEMYVFAFSDVEDLPIMLNLRIYVDGVFVNDFYQERILFMDYVYIPTRYITDDSYIEAELFPEYVFEKELKFTDKNDEKIITLVEPKENINPTFADLYFQDNSQDGSTGYIFPRSAFHVENEFKDGSYELRSQPTIKKEYSTYTLLHQAMLNDELIEREYYYDKSKCEYYYYFNNTLHPMGSYYDIHSVKFTRLHTIHIKPNNDSVINLPVKLMIHKRGYGMNLKVPDNGYPMIELKPLGFKFSKKNIRIYINGRLYPDQNYLLLPDRKNPTIRFLESFKKDDIIYLDVTPFQYTKVHEIRDTSVFGDIIDLKGIINKPFDPRYYDVYMNGKRLSLNNVIPLDPWSFALVNLTSRYNLVIYEKERDNFEYFSVDYNKDLYYFNIEDLMNEQYITEEDKQKFIDTIINDRKDPNLTIKPNTNDEIPDDIFDFGGILEASFFYENELIPKTFMNPDVVQFEDETLHDIYPNHYEKYVTNPYIESNDASKMDYVSAIRLDPDEYFEGGKGKDKGCIVYAVGHLNDVSEELLNTSIKINNDKNMINTVKRVISD